MEWQTCPWVYSSKNENRCLINQTGHAECLKDNCPLVILFKKTMPLDVVDLLGYVEEVDGNLADMNEKIEQQGKEIAELRKLIKDKPDGLIKVG